MLSNKMHHKWTRLIPYSFPSFPQSEIGFGKLETYIKLDKLGEVRPPTPNIRNMFC